MICFSQAVVDAVLSYRHGLQELAVTLSNGQEGKAYYYTEGGALLTAGTRVVLNTTAVDLKLGTGGYHFVHSVIEHGEEKHKLSERGMFEHDEEEHKLSERGMIEHDTFGHSVAGRDVDVREVAEHDVDVREVAGRDVDVREVAGRDVDVREVVESGTDGSPRGHLMKLRYTPIQRAVLAVEEAASPHHHVFKQDLDLQGMPVLIGELHSMLPMAVAWLRYITQDGIPGRAARRQSFNIVYVATDGGALPLVMSDHVVALDKLNWLQGTITYGHAYGGDLEALNKFTALLAAKHSLQADIAIVCMGPGIAGTGTTLGHTGIEVGELVNAVSILNGRPIVIPRLSKADPRPRHQGLSHHTVISLSTIALRSAELPLPHPSSVRLKQHVEKQVEEANLTSQHCITWHQPPTIEEMSTALVDYPLNLTSMGRSLANDPLYYQAICVAAAQAFKSLT